MTYNLDLDSSTIGGGPEPDRPKVVVRKAAKRDHFKVQYEDISSIICHRHDQNGFEQYLVRWNWPGLEGSQAPHSWHNLFELSNCLTKVQRYLDRFHSNNLQLVKRKRDSAIHESDFHEHYEEEVINGVLRREGNEIKVQPTTSKIFKQDLPTRAMKLRASELDTRQALYDIRTAWEKKLLHIPVKLELINQIDGSRPPLDFEFINQSLLGRGVQAAPLATMVGCGFIRRKAGPGGAYHKCNANMGQQVGCEYSRVCECLEFAAVDIDRVKTDEDKQLLESGETEGLPKRFPYHTKTRLLTDFYLDRRNCIYECNPRCQCGDECRTRVVQKGRTVSLQIFKTINRGWGLRCKEDLEKGQFVDTYRGEIITDSEASKREKAPNATSGVKSSYLYTLDKHVGPDLSENDCYVVDGEFMGGPTRFINHSCDPNMRQYTVSYNKYDNKIYELAFFARRHIPAMEELTFDYMDREDDDDDNQDNNQGDEQDDNDSDCVILDEIPDIFKKPGSQNKEHAGTTKMDCRCGKANCRRTLWI